jgi:hypothetical protein
MEEVWVAGILALFGVEMLLEALWVRRVFTLSPPVFRSLLPAASPGATSAFELPLADSVNDTAPLHRFKVHRVSDDLVLFRGGLPYGGFHAWVGRGYIRELPEGRGVLVTGCIPWGPVLWLGAWVLLGALGVRQWHDLTFIFGVLFVVCLGWNYMACESYRALTERLRSILAGEYS